MTSHVSLTISASAAPDAIAGATVCFPSCQLKGLSDASLGKLIREKIIFAEEFIVRKQQQLDASRN
jgi:hypothetical protein